MIDKSSFRKNALSERSNMPDRAVCKKSDSIFNALVSMNEFKKAQNIMLYVDFKNEVKTDRLIRHIIDSGKNAIVPISVIKGRKLIPSLLKDPDAELAVSTYGVKEPKKEFTRPFDKDSIDIVIVPGVAFGENGCRMGYGAGFYDRFIHSIQNNSLVTIGVAFELQVYDFIPCDDHDIILDYIVTENRIISNRSI
ncbi:5-formyltetrahydrofolate cyclo-ligase [Peptoclostridium litorale DSM 5388]|uniref:5-formyltetrahydrofolate cyclo-ligase n=1 Tax=Peptoclostridium litorale DSM 5388 TaxID=1121324 RepID=A0A069RDJ5_PEPLI|nr:5-formyltetrahydrofolate cyclo-ligase [Peptoclostridium litorale]KDR94838.1 5-formyltetrahydrofolate cyclo-ligase [Peptoclostridium litorale DSM 5388]SIN93797.1 5-formyltetrahydrofolate cyclo-ligase [Peptoclostridium litorale DSM 5388]